MKNSLFILMSDKGKSLAYVCTLFAIFLLTPGCKSIFFHAEEKKLQSTETLREENGSLSNSESVMKAGAHIKRIKVSKNLGRLIIEKENLSPVDETSKSPNYLAELWNIEFNEARIENIDEKKSTICSSSPNMAAFSGRGDRLFWIERLQISSERSRPDDQVIRGMSQEEDIQESSLFLSELPPPPLYLPWDSSVEYEALSSSPLPSFDPKQIDETRPVPHRTEFEISPSIGSSSPYKPVDLPEILSTFEDLHSNPQDSKPIFSTNGDNALSTRLLETNPLQADYLSQKKPARTFRLKTPNEVKKGTEVWLSPEAQWLACRQPVEDPSLHHSLVNTTPHNSINEREAPLSYSQENPEVSQEWVMVSTQEPQRVLRFPEPVPLSLDDLPSSPSLEGRVIDILAVSDAEDLVATLVEARPMTSPSKPVYKIVIWDLHVGKTVDLQKAKQPLKAIELSQISIHNPISRQKCKFSASGKLFATMNDSTCILIWQSTNGRQVTEIGEHDETIIDFDFFPNEMEIAIASSKKTPKIAIWDIRKGAKIREFLEKKPTPQLITLITIPCNQLIFFVNDDGEVKRLNLSSCKGS